jgi:hypothetical protein
MGYKADVLYESGCLRASRIWRKPEVGTSSLIPAPRARNTGAISFWSSVADCACPARRHRFIAYGGGRTASPCRFIQSLDHESVCIHSSPQTRPAGDPAFHKWAFEIAPSGERHSIPAHPLCVKASPTHPSLCELLGSLNPCQGTQPELTFRPGASRPAIGRTPKRHCLIANRGPSNPIGTQQSNCCLPTTPKPPRHWLRHTVPALALRKATVRPG